jgi:malate synthase
VKAPWYVDLLNVTLGVEDVAVARARIARYMETFADQGFRITENLDFT